MPAVGLGIDYRHTTAEALLAAAGESFDVVLNMEVVEHVADPQAYLVACQELLKPGGLMVCSTLNRNPKLHDGDHRGGMGDALAAEGHA
jgi:2-polyprenyl-6-hydroxyphenyl methylase/3-demethylubiquinone-9 3-methyltransferase